MVEYQMPNLYNGNQKGDPNDNEEPARFVSTTFPVVRIQENLQTKISRTTATSSRHVAGILSTLSESAQEQVWAVTTDKAGNLLELHKYSKGSSQETAAIINHITGHLFNRPNAHMVYLVHNHPSGDLVPSIADREVIKTLQSTLNIKGIRSKGVLIANHQFVEFSYTHVSNPEQVPSWTKEHFFPVSERTIVARKPQKPQKLFWGNSIIERFKVSADGILFTDSQARELEFIPFEKGKTRDVAAKILSRANELNAANAFINLQTNINTNRGTLYSALAQGLAGQGIDVRDVIGKNDKGEHVSFAKEKILVPPDPAAIAQLDSDEVLYATSSDFDVTKSKAFKTWFKNSKLRTAKGPLKVFHGSKKAFTRFDSGTAYFTCAEQYGRIKNSNSVMPVYLSIQKPYYTENLSFVESLHLFPDKIAKLKDIGYDGVIYSSKHDITKGPSGWGDDYPQYVAFEPNQVKSAIGNSGSFNPDNHDIRYCTDAMPGQGLSLKDIQKRFKGQTVFKSKDGSISIHFKNGKGAKIKFIDHISDDEFKMLISSGRMDEEGMFLGKSVNNEIYLNKDYASTWIRDHEFLHLLKNIGMVTDKDFEALDQQIQSWINRDSINFNLSDPTENRAHALAQILENRESNRETLWGFITQKVTDFIDGLLHIGRSSARKLAREIESGRIFERTVKEDHMTDSSQSLADLSIDRDIEQHIKSIQENEAELLDNAETILEELYQIDIAQQNIDSAWLWKMEYCKDHQLSPAQNWAWEQAENAYHYEMQENSRKSPS